MLGDLDYVAVVKGKSLVFVQLTQRDPYDLRMILYAVDDARVPGLHEVIQTANHESDQGHVPGVPHLRAT